MNLLLMRHAAAIEVGSIKRDLQRALTARGRHLAPRIAAVLVEQNLVPKRILVSPAIRTQQTVEALLTVLGGVEVKVVDALYQASPMTILEVIHLHGQGADPLLVVGHNPGLETTVSNIAGNIVPFGTGALAHAVIVPGESSEVLAVWRPDELPAV